MNYLASNVSGTRLRNPPLDSKGLDSFPQIKYELCKKVGRVGSQGSVESSRSQFPFSFGQIYSRKCNPSR